MEAPLFSVCVPARNEEKFIGKCLESIRAAEKLSALPVEIIVALNRCTDRTEEIARSFAARIVHEDAKNLSRIRNVAAQAARGEILVTIDADSRMTPNMLSEIHKHLGTGRVIGGGVFIKPDRLSLGILCTGIFLALVFLPLRLSAGLFWCFKKDFDAIGGFDEKLITAEDADFAYRLRKHGKKTHRRLKTLFRAHIVTSCRKFDQFGDWYFLNPLRLWRFATGHRQEADRHWYDVLR